MKVRTKVWIDNDHGNVIFGTGRLRMLEAIDRLGSMNKAAQELNMSYRALWGRIKSTEERLGTKVLFTKPGGGKGGGSALTPAGKRLLEDYKRLKGRIVKVADQEFQKIFGVKNVHEK
ncbi:MAG: LysR family transcriptional regulator [Deltaproteobacteria bacterium]|nr:LysR family transcriptional regulator [Deltaproteobacteria bacterium]MBW2074216.1 LysR family transcriptional regulator [Deltaproteobacteria bacterium]RLB84021.1 MAG: ModE family transcriptional regulator [Deltaproteobacteria bacterium]